MKKATLLLSCVCLVLTAKSQSSFSDNFDGYTVNSYLGTQSTDWTTWSYADGTSEDVKVVNTDAHSGAQSIYFASTSSSGGPTDCVLPFPAQYTDGNFALTMWMKVPSGKGAYFNVQAEPAIGTTWALDVTLDAGGIDFVDENGNSILTGSYPEGAWFEFKLTMDLTNNVWEALVDGTSQGTWSNSANSVASIDIFPLDATNQYWVDDVSYTYTPDVANGVAESKIINSSFGLYPNPATSVFSVSGNLEKSSGIQLEVFQVNGAMVASKIYDKPAGSFVLPFDLKDFEAGIYFVKVTADNKSTMMKLIKE
jgi:hypothetical protein